MKTIKIILSFIIISLFSISCDDWLDVKPKTQVESSELLKDEAGYKDALWGVYTLMVQKFNVRVKHDGVIGCHGKNLFPCRDVGYSISSQYV